MILDHLFKQEQNPPNLHHHLIIPAWATHCHHSIFQTLVFKPKLRVHTAKSFETLS
jgi:phosphoribosylformylglycinamidine (FGAM) synthase-like enzyme